jgi:non-specific serine/threonine protein kinase
MSVFRGGFDRDAADRVAGASLAVLASLVDKSLIRFNAPGRYDLHELLRQYLAERLMLADDGEVAALTGRHLDYFSELAHTAEAHLYGPEQETWFDRLEIEHDNLRVALAWSIRDGRAEAGLRLGGALGFFWELRSHWYEGYESMTNLVEHAADVAPLVRAKALRFAAVFAEYARDLPHARAYCEESLALARASNDPSSIAWSLCTQALYVESPVNPAGAVVLFDQALALFREVGDAWGTSHTLRRMAIILMLQGDYARARPLVEEAVAGARTAGDKNALAWSLFLFGNVVWLQEGDIKRATALLEEALTLSPQIRDWGHHMWLQFTLGAAARVQGNYERARACYAEVLVLMRDRQVSAYQKWPELLAGALSGLGGVAVAQGRPAHAARLFGAASHVPEPSPPMFFRVDRERDAVAAQSALGDAAFDAAFSEGQALTSEQAIDLAIRGEARLRRRRVTSTARSDDTPRAGLDAFRA